MCFFCECDGSRKWRERTEQKLDLILETVSKSTHLSPEDRAAIQATTAKLKANTEAANAAIAANNPDAAHKEKP